ncbi:MAG: hypothetical protein RMJ18_03090 [Candidatus Aenigmarchaeota archaeon]|nr:hypothetical protein [Candidatus Aenigmarchaeota archaeon]MDW8160375.1 hypothetical protein [Candidatus Aenigmarchaeota archaeon]
MVEETPLLISFPKVEEIYVVPGNGGTYFFQKCKPIESYKGKKLTIRSVDEIVEFAKREDIGFLRKF